MSVPYDVRSSIVACSLEKNSKKYFENMGGQLDFLGRVHMPSARGGQLSGEGQLPALAIVKRGGVKRQLRL